MSEVISRPKGAVSKKRTSPQVIEQVEEVDYQEVNYAPFLGRSENVSLWLRVVARVIDVGYLNFLAYYVLDAQFLSLKGLPYVADSLSFLIALILDACIYFLFGNTVGKFLLGVKIARTDNNPLTFSDILKRNMLLWGQGLGCGFIWLLVPCCSYQCFRVWRGQKTTYDQHGGFEVYAGKRSILGTVAAFICMILSLFTLVVVQVYANSWENPVTHKEMILPFRWKYEEDSKNTDEWKFLSEKGEGFVTLKRMEKVFDDSPYEKVQAFIKKGAVEKLGKVVDNSVEQIGDTKYQIFAGRSKESAVLMHITLVRNEKNNATWYIMSAAQDGSEREDATEIEKHLLATLVE